jgi:hypothetical protein
MTPFLCSVSLIVEEAQSREGKERRDREREEKGEKIEMSDSI